MQVLVTSKKKPSKASRRSGRSQTVMVVVAPVDKQDKQSTSLLLTLLRDRLVFLLLAVGDTRTHWLQCLGSTRSRSSPPVEPISQRANTQRKQQKCLPTAAEAQGRRDQVARVRSLFATATLQRKAGMALFEVLVFPEEWRSTQHLQRIYDLLASAVDSIHMSMYALTRAGRKKEKAQV